MKASPNPGYSVQPGNALSKLKKARGSAPQRLQDPSRFSSPDNMRENSPRRQELTSCKNLKGTCDRAMKSDSNTSASRKSFFYKKKQEKSLLTFLPTHPCSRLPPLLPPAALAPPSNITMLCYYLLVFFSRSILYLLLYQSQA